MSFIDTVRGIAGKTIKNGGLTNTAANFAGQKIPSGQNSGQPPWMQYTNMLNNNVKNMVTAPLKQKNNTQAPGTDPAQEMQPLQQQAPGKNGYTPTTAPYGMDMSNPGVQEQFWNQNQNLWTKGAFQGPGQGEQFWNKVQGNFNKAGADLTPQFNAYYDQAAKNAASSANNQAAARGVYGSSQALNGVNSAVADVESQRAKASTDFMFNNAANQRAALGQYGDLAFGAQGMSNNRNAMDMNALNSAYSAAGQAQNQRGNRIQNQFNNQATMTGMYLPFLQNQYGGMLQNDQNLVTGAQETKVGAATNALNQQQQNRQNNTQDLSTGLSLYGAFGGGRSSASAPSTPTPQYNPNYGGNYGGYAGPY